MKKQDLLFCISGLSFAFLLSGCVVRTYPVTRDRIDQEITGNRGYIQGQKSMVEEQDRKATRTTQVVEVELHSPFKFESAPKPKMGKNLTTAGEEQYGQETIGSMEGNKGYLSSSISPDITASGTTEKYTVLKNDTLQKISKKFYGTTKLWKWIYDCNNGVLKSPNSIYPGQVINVPIEKQTLKETKENLK